jgi:hypothetical protein
MSEGAEYSSVSFKDDKRTISLTLPRRWSSRGDVSRLRLAPPDQSFAEGVIQALPAKGQPAFDEATIKALEHLVLTSLPPGSQFATVLRREKNPILLGQNLSYGFSVSFQTLGLTFQRSVLFVNCPEQQLVFRFSAPKTVFENLNKSFRQTLYSWQWRDRATATLAASR